ncbi:MAG: hypothetical protein U0Z53_23945 [Blastocatellia bacterium]
MEDTFDTELTAEQKAEIRRQIDWYLEAMRRILAEMSKDRAEIDRLKAETWEMLDQMRKAA